MKKFRGNYYHTLDQKGRFTLPSEFKEVLLESAAASVMITRMDGCLFAYPLEEWEEIENRILSLPTTSETIRRFRRIFVGGAFECPFDKQGRILVPPPLREYAGLDRDIVLVSAVSHFEIWSKSRWENEFLSWEEELKQPQARADIAPIGL
uniref:Transcriptional regulator MraZ n=1 Tax=Desulfatirhabdium butyrativorans TaxID=340467 RepID=A0A7C4RQK4_9BACT